VDSITLQTQSVSPLQLPDVLMQSSVPEPPTPAGQPPTAPLSGATAGFSKSSPSQTGQNEPASIPLKICKVNLRAGTGREGEAGRNAARENKRKKESTALYSGEKTNLLTRKMQWEKCTGL